MRSCDAPWCTVRMRILFRTEVFGRPAPSVPAGPRHLIVSEHGGKRGREPAILAFFPRPHPLHSTARRVASPSRVRERPWSFSSSELEWA